MSEGVEFLFGWPRNLKLQKYAVLLALLPNFDH